MRFLRRGIGAFALALVMPAAAAATPFQVDVSLGSNPAFSVDFSSTLVSLSSADIDLSSFTGPNTEFSSAAPIAVEQVPGGTPQIAAFKMGTLDAVSGTYSNGNFIGQFGAGSFDIDLLTGNQANPLAPWLSASFASATLVLQDITDPANTIGYFYAPATLSGPSFDQSGLVNPGYFVFGLGGETLSANTGSVNASYLTFGYSDASVPVPEPATISLLAIGLAGMACQRSRRRSGRPHSGQ